MAASNINPAIAKQLNNGNLLCLICNTQVNSKIWIAHYNGRKHRDNVARFKNRHSRATNQSELKRVVAEPSTSSVVSTKRMKTQVQDTISNDEAFLEQTNGSTPWEKDSINKSVSSTVSVHCKRIIEGVPEGFFEDEKLNKRVVETIEKDAIIEKEYANFMKELDKVDLEGDEQKDTEEYYDALEHDIALIDEQIDQWKRVNRLELRRDELMVKATAADKRNPESMVDEQMMGINTDENDSDLEIDWRCKGI